MAVRFSEDQVVRATNGRKVRSGARASFDAVSTDTRQLTPGCLFVALVGEKFDAHDFLAQAAAGGAGGVVVQKGKTLPELPSDFAVIEVDDTLAALGGLARFHRSRFKGRVGAIGGSNGKTTTKEMVAAILGVRGAALKTEGNLNNEIGVPLTLFRLEPTHVAAAIELGMNHAGEITRLTAIAQPDAAVITVVQPEHLEGLGSLEGVAAAEGELFRALRPGAVAVVNLDEPLIVKQMEGSVAEQLTFGRHPDARIRLVDVQALGRDGLRATIRDGGNDHPVRLSFVGEHNAHNATAAYALARALGYTPDECVRGLETARPYARRLNLVDTADGFTVLDDCYNANPGSMTAAIQTVKGLAGAEGRAVAVLGDMLELGVGEDGEHRSVGALASSLGLVAFFGPRSRHGFEAARALGDRSAHFESDVNALVAWLKPKLQKGDVVLVKGSRGMKLERVVQALSGQAATPGGH